MQAARSYLGMQAKSYPELYSTVCASPKVLEEPGREEIKAASGTRAGQGHGHGHGHGRVRGNRGRERTLA